MDEAIGLMSGSIALQCKLLHDSQQIDEAAIPKA